MKILGFKKLQTFTLGVLLILSIAACKKKDSTSEPEPPEPPAPSTETVVSFKISLFNSTKKSWDKPEAYVIAPGYQSPTIALSVSTLTSTFPPPCDDYYFNAALNYNLTLKKETVDTIILRNMNGTGQVIFQAKIVYDLTKSPAVMTSISIGTVKTGLVCSNELRKISFGYH